MKPLRGYICCGIHMACTTTRKPTRNLTVRYRQCEVCGSKVITEERVSKTRSPKAGSDTANVEAGSLEQG